MIKAKINWLSLEEGGRERPMPAGARYSPIIILKGGSAHDGWNSSIMFITTEINENNESLIEFDFFNKDSYPPDRYEKLINGEEFSLYEGARKVAVGRVII
ncbi:MAG TPA: hypothetical protein DCP51_05725 [Clostridiales bacterium]|nr:hypothetical protein [Clostridiales bacterium]